jgi:hypothetical protein
MLAANGRQLGEDGILAQIFNRSINFKVSAKL